MKPTVTVNKLFLILFVTLQIIIVGVIVYAIISPKTVIVQIEKLDNSYSVEKPLEVIPPRIP